MLPFLQENPFFTREVRAFGRRGLALLAWPLAVQALFLFAALLLMERAAAGALKPVDAWRGLALVAFGLGHGAVCGGVGWIAGKRVLGDEHGRGALDGLRLITLPPAVWLAQKLVFPLYLLVMVWAAALPFYGAVALRGHFLPDQLAPGAQLALCLGLLTFGAALLAPPEGLRSPIRGGQRARRGAAWSDVLLMGLPAWIALILLRLALDWMGYALGSRLTPFRAASFFGWVLPTNHGLALLLAGYAVTCLGAAYAVANPADARAAPLRTASRGFGAGWAYLLFLGYQWTPAPTPGFVLSAVLGLVVAVLVALPAEWHQHRDLGPGRKVVGEDPLAGMELSWLGGLWDNAVFLRDLRVALRGGSLARQFLLNGVGVGLLSAAVCGLGQPMVGGSRLQQLASGAMMATSWLMLPALLAYGGRSLANWGTERRCSTLLQLFASPLRTDAVVRGRWAAAVLAGMVRALPVPLFFLGGALVLEPHTEVLSYLGQGVWLATLGLILSAGLAGSAQDTAVQLEDLFCAGCVAVYVVMAEGALFLWLWTQSPLVGGVPDRSGPAAYAWMMVPVNLLITAGVYRRAVAALKPAADKGPSAEKDKEKDLRGRVMGARCF